MPYLQGALICDAARDYQGKVSILGGFVSGIVSPGFPFVAPIWFAGRVAFEHDEFLEPHELLVQAKSASGEVLGELRGQMSGQQEESPLGEDMLPGINFVAPLPFPIREEGMYWVELIVDGQMFSRLPLKVIVGPPAGT